MSSESQPTGFVRRIRERIGSTAPKDLKVGMTYELQEPIEDVRFAEPNKDKGVLEKNFSDTDEAGRLFPVNLQIALTSDVQDATDQREERKNKFMDSLNAKPHRAQHTAPKIDLFPGAQFKVVAIEKLGDNDHKSPMCAIQINKHADMVSIYPGGHDDPPYKHSIADIQSINGQDPKEFISGEYFYIYPTRQNLEALRRK